MKYICSPQGAWMLCEERKANAQLYHRMISSGMGTSKDIIRLSPKGRVGHSG